MYKINQSPLEKPKETFAESPDRLIYFAFSMPEALETLRHIYGSEDSAKDAVREAIAYINDNRDNQRNQQINLDFISAAFATGDALGTYAKFYSNPQEAKAALNNNLSIEYLYNLELFGMPDSFPTRNLEQAFKAALSVKDGNRQFNEIFGDEVAHDLAKFMLDPVYSEKNRNILREQINDCVKNNSSNINGLVENLEQISQTISYIENMPDFLKGLNKNVMQRAENKRKDPEIPQELIELKTDIANIIQQAKDGDEASAINNLQKLYSEEIPDRLSHINHYVRQNLINNKFSQQYANTPSFIIANIIKNEGNNWKAKLSEICGGEKAAKNILAKNLVEIKKLTRCELLQNALEKDVALEMYKWVFGEEKAISHLQDILAPQESDENYIVSDKLKTAAHAFATGDALATYEKIFSPEQAKEILASSVRKFPVISMQAAADNQQNISEQYEQIFTKDEVAQILRDTLTDVLNQIDSKEILFLDKKENSNFLFDEIKNYLGADEANQLLKRYSDLLFNYSEALFDASTHPVNISDYTQEKILSNPDSVSFFTEHFPDIKQQQHPENVRNILAASAFNTDNPKAFLDNVMGDRLTTELLRKDRWELLEKLNVKHYGKQTLETDVRYWSPAHLQSAIGYSANQIDLPTH